MDIYDEKYDKQNIKAFAQFRLLQCVHIEESMHKQGNVKITKPNELSLIMYITFCFCLFVFFFQTFPAGFLSQKDDLNFGHGSY